jgi:hypothetical protein
LPSNRGSTPPTGVAETSVGLLLDDLERIDLLLLAQLAPDRVEQQVGDVIGQRAAHQKFERRVIDAFHIPRPVGLLGLDPALRQQVADRASDGLEFVARRGGGDWNDLIEGQMPFVQRIAAAGKPDRAAIEVVDGIVARHPLVPFIDAGRTPARVRDSRRTGTSTLCVIETASSRQIQRRDGLAQHARAPA